MRWQHRRAGDVKKLCRMCEFPENFYMQQPFVKVEMCDGYIQASTAWHYSVFVLRRCESKWNFLGKHASNEAPCSSGVPSFRVSNKAHWSCLRQVPIIDAKTIFCVDMLVKGKKLSRVYCTNMCCALSTAMKISVGSIHTQSCIEK